MKRIDRETVQRIIDATDIVEVVSDFVSLKKRGANYIGLCPFHNERTPSFSVSKSKGVCKCFSCGKGGSAIGFLMEHEQISYYEALRWLARKYNIEIKEREMTDAERQQASEREALMAINEWAANHFEHNLTTTQGRNIGYSYFVERGISDQSIKKFRLGYAMDRSDEVSRSALEAGYTEHYLIASGLCSRTERGTLYDRFCGRVIYPIMSVSGKAVAFGGRTLRSDKHTAKYVNSPETALYHKSNELYGLYQAKGAIVRQDKCLLVEGYMDVISMSQSGIENVVASSGTSLTQGQIRLIHRFTSNVTVIYDSDPAGIKASLRGIDLLLAEGLDIKVLLLPDGDDPDSFAQSHTTEQVRQYIDENETDFITFKTNILLQGAHNDPTRRAAVISDIIRSIAVIPDAIKRQVYVQECARALGMSEKILSLELAKAMANAADKASIQQQRENAGRQLAEMDTDDNITTSGQDGTSAQDAGSPTDGSKTVESSPDAPASTSISAAYDPVSLMPYEREIIRLVLRYGMFKLCDYYDENDTLRPLSVISFIDSQLNVDNIAIGNKAFAKVWKMSIAIEQDIWPKAYESGVKAIDAEIDELRKAGIEKMRLDPDINDMTRIKAAESALNTSLDNRRNQLIRDLEYNFAGRILANDSDNEVRHIAADLISDKYKLSRIHTHGSSSKTEEEKLGEIVPRALYELKNKIIDNQIKEICIVMGQAHLANDAAKVTDCLIQIQQLKNVASEYARVLGERVINPGSAFH